MTVARATASIAVPARPGDLVASVQANCELADALHAIFTESSVSEIFLGDNT